MKLSSLLKEIEKPKKGELYLIRATTKAEASKNNPLQFGDYWSTIDNPQKLKDNLNSNEMYIREEDPYAIVVIGNYDELEIEEGNPGDMHLRSSELFDKKYSPSTRIAYKGKLKDLVNKL